MEEKKIDSNTIIGFILIGLILVWVIYKNQPTPEEIKQRKENREQRAENPSTPPAKPLYENPQNTQDSSAINGARERFGLLAPAAYPTPSSTDTLLLENNLVQLKISARGGQLVEVKMKNFTSYNHTPVYLIKDNNAQFNLHFKTADGKPINTGELYFYPEYFKEGENQVLSMKLKASDGGFLEYRYTLKPNEYLIDFSIRSQGWKTIADVSREIAVDWQLKGMRQAKSITYENRYTRLTYQHNNEKISKLSPASDDEETGSNIRWVSYRQHFFSSILAADAPFKSAILHSKNLVKEEDENARFTKIYKASIPLEVKSGELNTNLYWYYGPTHFAVLKRYKDLNLAASIPFGWGIFGWINKYIFTPLYESLSAVMPYGIAIIVMTILVRLVLSPFTYKSYLSQVKMKVLRPEVMEINEKYKDEPMKRQQETMKIYSRAGASPMSGCIPALLQLPVFYALFMFFPTAFALRQKRFLWAEDLSSYDVIATLPFKIPFYGDHVSLFPILASAAIFIYMMMTAAQTTPAPQPGMPNMKFLIYLSPILMLFFFNNYASGLSLYYFISNLITIFIMLAIKSFIIDEAKIHAQIEENKKKPRKESRLQRKMREMMEQAEAQKKIKKKKG